LVEEWEEQVEEEAAKKGVQMGAKATEKRG
jgi:hypothetical protein